MKFVNRNRELKKLSRKRGALTVVFGRRRIGKTALLLEYLKSYTQRSGYYSQAIEGSQSIQVMQTCADLSGLLPKVPVDNWISFFELLSTVKKKCVIVLDEFPYLVKTSPALPSIIQKWLDHRCPKGMHLILLGSSQTMMHDMFLKGSAPLYERAGDIIQVKPLSYKYFCELKGLSPLDKESYLKFSLVGGVPKYWSFIEKNQDLLEIVWDLFFEEGSRLEAEPDRLLKDENIVGEQGKSILELVGRGCHRPSEIANRMGIKQTSLSKPLQMLKDASLLEREIPFSESVRSTKRSLYKLNDHCLAFWFSCYSPHRSRWLNYSKKTRNKLIEDHASLMFERDFRMLFRYACRYWEPDIEFDCVRHFGVEEKRIMVSEIKFRQLKWQEKEKLYYQLEEKFNRSQLAKKFKAQFEVLGLEDVLSFLYKGDT